MLIFISFSLSAQNPNWSINRADFEYQMQFTASLKVDGNLLTNTNDQVAAFVGNELRGFGNVVFDADDNKYVCFFPAYSNTIGETLSFKIYNSTTNTVVNAVQTQVFSIDERVGGVFQSFLISNTSLNNQAVLSSFNFQEITAVSNSKNANTFTIVLPVGTNLTSLIPVFSVSNKAEVFIDFKKQISGSSTVDFSNAVTYQILSEDEKVLEEYIINASTAISTTKPTVVLSSLENTITNKKTIALTATFSESISGFSEEDLEVTNAVVSNVSSTNNNTFSFSLTPINSGNYSVFVKENSVVSNTSIGNLASNTLSFIFDDEAPIIINQEHFKDQKYFQITFSESVVNVLITNFLLAGNTSVDFTLNNIEEVSASVYKIYYTGASSNKGNLFLQSKPSTTISDLSSNVLLSQTSETFYLNNTDNYFNQNSGNWSDANNWSLARLPLAKDHLIINATASTTADVSGLTVNKISNLGTTILPKINSISVDEFENSGTFTINSDRNTSGSLLVNSKTSGGVNFKMMQLLANKWHLISVPTKGQKIKEFAENLQNEIRINTSVTPNRYALGYYKDANAIGNKWEYYTSDVNLLEEFTNAKGYAVSRVNDGEILFNGSLEIVSIDKTLEPNSWNAIGNPYTTYYPINKNDGQDFLTENNSKLEIPAVYVWDTIQNKYVATTNLKTSKALTIPAGKGFFVKTNTSTSVNFNHLNRAITAINTSASKAENNVPYFKLTVINNSNIAVSTDIIFTETATNNFNPLEDIPNFDGASFDVNSHLVENSDDKNYTIQSLPKAQIENLIIPLSVKAFKDDVLSFSINTINFPEDIVVYLEDKVKNKIILLNNTNTVYTTNLEEDLTGIGRFYLHTSAKVLSVNSNNLNSIQIYKLTKNVIKVIGIENKTVTFKLFDILGKQVFETNFKSNLNNDVVLPSLKSAIYFVELQTDNGKISKKIVLE